MFTLCILLLLTSAAAQLNTINGNVTLDIFDINHTLTIYSDPSSPYYPKDYYINVVVTEQHIYALGSNNVVQIYDQANLTLPPQVFSNYSYSFSPTYTMVYISVNENETLMVLTSFVNLNV